MPDDPETEAALSTTIPSPSSVAPRAERSPQRSLKGASSVTGAVHLRPISPDRSGLETWRAPPANSFDPGNFADEQRASILQPVDKGLAAWSYVAGAFAMYIVVWGRFHDSSSHHSSEIDAFGLGFPQSFPIFQTHLSIGPQAQYPSSVLIRLLAPGIQDIEEGILFQILPKANRHRRFLVVVGINTMITAVFLASYATSDWQIVLTEGVLFGVGGILLNFVHVSILPEWFDKKRGQAMGIIWMGYRLGALAFPPLCQWLLETHGYEECLRVLIGPMLALLLPSIVLLRGRYHAATVTSQTPKPSVSKLKALRQPHVLFYFVAALLWDLVTNVPFMFIATFAADLQLSKSDQTLAFSLVQISNILGTYACGWLSDQGFHENLLGGIAVATGTTHFLLWGFCKSRIGLFVYTLTIGLVSGGTYTVVIRRAPNDIVPGFINCLVPFYAQVAGKDNELFTAVHSLFSFGSGFAILSVGPIGAEILRHSPSTDINAYAIGKYQVIRFF